MMRGVLLLILVCVCLSSCVVSSNEHQYGEIAKFSMIEETLYPDFAVRYVGRRREASERYPRGFTYYDFEVASEDERLTVSWTPGTGAIAPLPFSFGGEEFFLVLKVNELKREDYLLGEDEMIIWQKDVYLRELDQSR